MGACAVTCAPRREIPAPNLISDKIDQDLERQRLENRAVVKLLLLGSGNSGKSTVMKQFKILHKNGFSSEERRIFRDAIWKSMVESMKTLALWASQLEENELRAVEELELRAVEEQLLSPAYPDMYEGGLAPLYHDNKGEGELGNSGGMLLHTAPQHPEEDIEPYLRFLLHMVTDTQQPHEKVSIAVLPQQVQYSSTPRTYPSEQPLSSFAHEVGKSQEEEQRKVQEDADALRAKSRNERARLQEEDHEVVELDPEDQMLLRSAERLDQLEKEQAGAAEAARPVDELPPSETEEEEYLAQLKRQKAASKAARKVSKAATATQASSGAPAESPATEAEDAPGEADPSRLSQEAAPPSVRLSVARTSTMTNGTELGSDSGAAPPMSASTLSADQAAVVPNSATHSPTEASATPPSSQPASTPGGSKPKKKKKSDKKKRQPPNSVDRMALLLGENLPETNLLDLSPLPSIRKGRGSNPHRHGGSSLHDGSNDSVASMISSGGNGSVNGVQPAVEWKEMTLARLLVKLWQSRRIQFVFQMEERYPTLEAPIAYFMQHADRICRPNYSPSNEDILIARKRTSGVNLLAFEENGARFLIIDMGGQRTERRKWLSHFDSVDAVLFVVGLDQYDQTMMEDGETNRLRDSIELFSEMCSSPWFRNSPFLLFLNKSDLFKMKIKTIPITTCFRSYQGDPHDYDMALQYIENTFRTTHARFVQLGREQERAQRGKGKSSSYSTDNSAPALFPYVTCATDTHAMKFVIETCQEIVMKDELEKFGFF